MNLTDREVKIINYIEQKFYETGHLPTNEKIGDDLGFSKQVVAQSWKKDLFRQALVARGVDLNPEQSEELLTTEQLLVANMIMNVLDKTSIREKLKTVSTALGKSITVQTYNGWLNQASFRAYIQKRAEKQFGAADPSALMAHIKAINDGDMNAVKLYYEMTGRYNPRLQVDVNIESVIVSVVEIISRHVTDPEALQAIASDIERLELGPGASKMNNSIIDIPVSQPVESSASGF